LSQARHEAFARVYEEEVWSVYGFFGYRLGSRPEAEDLTQLTFERALRAWDRFDDRRASARTWLLTIAHNLLVDHYRGKGSVAHEPIPEGEAGEAMLGQTEPVAYDLGLSPELEEAMSRLDERERELLALRFGGDLTGPEIAELTGLSVANVQQILSRMLRKLRDDLEPSSDAPSAQGTGAARPG
jgi:RNA polymerase sigma factor (sigma-70 family)